MTFRPIARGGSGGPPSGAAGGVLSGTYPNPGMAAGAAVANIGAHGLPVADIVAGLSGQVLGGIGPSYDYPPGYEFGYAQVTSDVSVTATTAATADAIATTAAFTYDGNTTVFIHCFSPDTGRGTSNITGVVFMDGALLQDAVFFYNTGTRAGQNGFFRYKPAAGAHTFGFRAYVDGGTGHIFGSDSTAFVRVTKAA